MTTEERIDMVAAAAARHFRTFGGGVVRGADLNNPVALAMVNQEAQFALGVSVRDVVAFVADYFVSGERA